ncbi:quinone oxidoreductase 19 [Heterobasidion irregulare TC 32-1]|uniref:Quinone oxidoreductase 19 n=1 Tax=Heterobasidion irregulare (strain TC 32-1) TaxID=747525 RepID=W4KCM0_HETIT|nr:quinone oxidoreductase 19 [Heterobasidion irregulare TC 32-1]ETW83489.1 quinone oxidoreductase 19 [Heterobasidion irregulare TC 32-1]
MSLPEVQKALLLAAKGQVLVKIHSSALNPADNYIQSLGIFVEEWPFILPNVSFERASTLPLGLATASIGLYAEKICRGSAGLYPPWEESGRGKYKGQPILVIGGASSVGQFSAYIIGKLSGFSLIITTCSTHSAAYCVAAGATHPIDYYTTPYSELSSVVRVIVGPSTFVSDILAPRGSIVMVATPAVAKDGEEAKDGKRAVNFGAALYGKLTALLEEEAIKPNNMDVLPDGLAGIPDGLKRLLGGVSGVKLVAHPQETP